MHKVLIFLFLMLAVSVFANPKAKPSIPAGSCGINQYRSTTPAAAEFYIVGGKPVVKKHTYPWQVSLQVRSQHLCGGTIISENHILTAAHCFKGTGATPKLWTVAAGKHSLNKVEAGEQVYRVAKIAIHESYNGEENINDVALMTLAKSIAFSDTIQPACLPDKETTGDLVDVNATITGWGVMREDGDTPTTLREVNIPIITNAKCQAKYTEYEIIDGMMCAGYDAGGKDACQGDSGGPMVFWKDGRYEIIGVISWGIGCAHQNRPGVYTRVAYYMDWIQSKMADTADSE